MWLIVGVSLIMFPRLALGLSGFETGVAVMPLVKGDTDLTDDDWEDIHTTRSTGRPPDRQAHDLLEGRIKNTRKLLRNAALIMSVFLITSSLVTTMMIPPEKFQIGGEANGRALAYLAGAGVGIAANRSIQLETMAGGWAAGAAGNCRIPL